MTYCYLHNTDDLLRDVRAGDIEKNILIARRTLKKVRYKRYDLGGVPTGSLHLPVFTVDTGR